MAQLSISEVLEALGALYGSTADELNTSEYNRGLNDGYRDGYLDGIVDRWKTVNDAEPEAASNQRNYEAKRKGQAGEDWAEWAGESVSEVLGRIARWYSGLDIRI